MAGVRCVAKSCGDGIIAGTEQCDDHEPELERRLQLDVQARAGLRVHDESTARASATRRPCGDGVKEGFEQCDDDNLIPYDGCSPTCTIEPQCAGGQCTPVCGDGLKFPQEACDDGNTRSGDGCSATCTARDGLRLHGDHPEPAQPTCRSSDPLSRLSLAANHERSDAGRRRARHGHPDFQIDPVQRRHWPREVRRSTRRQAGLQ